MKHAEPDPPVPDVLLERLRLRELPAAEEAALTSRLAREPELRQRLDVLGESDAFLASSGHLDRLAARVSAIADRPKPPVERLKTAHIRGWAITAAAVAAAAVLLPRAIARRAPDDSAPRQEEGSDTRVKGLEPTLTVFRKTAGGTETLGEGTLTREGDLIRVAYNSAGRPFGAILSVDGRGAVTVHLPRGGAQAARLAPGGAVLLDEAYQLDDAPVRERFFFITSEAPFPLPPVVEAARATAPRGSAVLELTPGLDQFVMTLQKGPPR